MFEALATAIDELEVPVEGAALAEAFALADRLASKLSAAVGVFDAAGWDLDGATSMTAWLREAARLSGREASRVVQTASRLRSLPVTASAWAEGVVSGGQVGAVLANVSPRTLAAFVADEVTVLRAVAHPEIRDRYCFLDLAAPGG